jgi:hypothetical protein
VPSEDILPRNNPHNTRAPNGHRQCHCPHGRVDVLRMTQVPGRLSSTVCASAYCCAFGNASAPGVEMRYQSSAIRTMRPGICGPFRTQVSTPKLARVRGIMAK